jgi:hypothetical protein
MIPSLSAEALSLLSTVPVIKRARGWRLYASDGARYLDMYADGGRSISGRRSGESDRTAKEAIDRGLLSPFPTFWENRLGKAILAWLPGYVGMRFFISEAEAVMALAAKDDDFAERLREGLPFSDALDRFAGKLFLESPLNEYRKDREKDPQYSAFGGRYAIAVLPLAPAWSFGIILAKTPGDLASLKAKGYDGKSPSTQEITLNTPIPAVKLATATRSLADFNSFAVDYNEKLWCLIDPFITGIFVRSGPWLYPSYPATEHPHVFAACLEKGILISPDYGTPSIVPAEYDQGEVAPLRTIIG